MTPPKHEISTAVDEEEASVADNSQARKVQEIAPAIVKTAHTDGTDTAVTSTVQTTTIEDIVPDHSANEKPARSPKDDGHDKEAQSEGHDSSEWHGFSDASSREGSPESSPMGPRPCPDNGTEPVTHGDPQPGNATETGDGPDTKPVATPKDPRRGRRPNIDWDTAGLVHQRRTAPNAEAVDPLFIRPRGHNPLRPLTPSQEQSQKLLLSRLGRR